MRRNSIGGELSLLLAIMLILGAVILSKTPLVLASPAVPNPPTELRTENQVNPIITDFTPKFSAIFTDNDVGDNAENMEIWVGTSMGDNDMWASGWIDNGMAQKQEDISTVWSETNLYAGHIHQVGQRLTISGKVSKLAFAIGKYGSPTGDVTFSVRYLDNSIILSKVWGDVSNLSGSLEWKEVTFDAPAVIDNEVMILVEYSGGSSTNRVKTGASSTDVKAGEAGYYYSIEFSGWLSAGSYWDIGYRLTFQIENNTRYLDVSYDGLPLSRGVTYYWKTRFMDQTGAAGAWSIETATFRINSTPNSPTSLLCEGQANPTRITDLMPEFSAIGTDNDGDQMNYYALQVDNDSDFGSPIYNKTKASITAFDNNTRCSDISYENSDLSRGVTYYWRIKFWDNNGNEGDWSTETATFKINSLPTTTNLETENQTNPTRLTTLTPTFSWMYSDPNEDNQSHWQIWVGTTSGTYDKWNSGEMSGTDNSDVYDGSALSRGETYYVQIMTKDNFEWSDWATGTFRINQLPTQTYSEQTFYEDYTPTLIWDFSDPDGDSQLGIKIQVDNDPGFGSLLWDHSDNTTTAQSKVYAGEALAKNVTYYARVQVRDGYEWSGTWSDNTFTILPIPSLIVAEVTVDSTSVDRKAHWAGDGDVRILVTVKDNEGRDAIENVHFWIRDNNNAVVVDNAMHIGYENVNDNTKRFWYDYEPSDIMLDNALGEFDVKVQAVSVNFENTKDYTDLGFELFTVNDHSITFSPIREIYAEGEIITFEPVVKSVASGSAVENAYLKLELISELGEVLRTVEGYTDGSGKLATYTTLLEADIGFYDVRISTSKGAIDGLKLYEDAFTVAAELLVSVESITPADDSVSGLLRSRSIVPEDVIVKVLVFDTAGTELLNLISDSMRVENAAPQLKSWEVPYGLTLREGTYSYRVEVWKADLGTLHHVAFAEVRLAVAPSQQPVGEWGCVDIVETKDGTFDVALYRESLVTNPTTVDKANFYFREIVPAPQGSTVLVSVSGLPATTARVDQYGTITRYFDVPASKTLKISMEVTINSAVKVEYLGETEVVAAVPKTLKEHQYRITNLTSTVLRELKLTFPVDGVVLVVDDEGRSVDFWKGESTTVEIRELGSYGETVLTLSSELPPTLDKMIERLITWTPFGIPIVVFTLGSGVFLCLMARKRAGAARKRAGVFSLLILFLLPTGLLMLAMWLGVL